ncbi:hypothetical protein CERSUDRAFT_43468 [Gelatoporia subvermispora B]|uniref:FYVE-domain-containing protein n=1 Tax=Ceriporiopsis subvermispora (strain B) TaxID=914234 RepID=M2RQB3_CERS8|nr:hypothetical protein CERSUDRAFT_43468 [Gelatoporia subvermispora B]
MHDDSEDEDFVYPGASEHSSPAPTPPETDGQVVAVVDPLAHASVIAAPARPSPPPASHDDSDEEEFTYPGASEDSPPAPTPPEANVQVVAAPGPQTPPSDYVPSAPVRPAKPSPLPAHLEALNAAAATGDLKCVQDAFRKAVENDNVDPFSLANDASPRSGLTALHTAARRGHINIVKWLMEECGAMSDVEDKEGEVCHNHVSALNGHLRVITYLLPDKADVHTKDADGWTALHNACAKGYLDIVRWLCEHGGAAAEVNGTRGIDVKSKGGWTPLMNAASKGHLPVVLYLLSKQSADPLVRNNWGETAYDVAAAVFEVWICEILQKSEAEKWRGTTVPYNPLAVHTTVPVVLYENQRLDMRLKTLAVTGGRPRFSASGLGRRGRRAPFELRLLAPDDGSGKKELPAWRSDVQLPLRDDPFMMPKPGNGPREGADRSHFWLSDWTLDVTPPGVDADEGWQYAQSFEDPDEQWTGERPPQLERLLSGSGAMTAGIGGGSSRSRASTSSSARTPTRPQAWVRRRRWVRVMRRRLDIPPLPYMEPDGSLYQLAEDGALIPYVPSDDGEFSDTEGQEMGAVRSGFSGQDYVARARYLAGTPYPEGEESNSGNSALELRRTIIKLERSTNELRQGVLDDDDTERKTQAEVLLNAYTRELERRRLAAGAQGVVITDDIQDDIDDDDSDDEFHYPGAESIETPRAPSIRSSNTDYFTRPTSSRAPTDLTPHLSQAPEFRVPTHEAPQKILTPRWTPPTPHQVHAQWERDDDVTECRECWRRFNFLNRRHCRRCGRIFCDRCSSYRALLDPSDIVHDPSAPGSAHITGLQRVCQTCYEQVTAAVPNGLQSSRTRSMERIVVDQGRLSIPSPTGQSSSQLSDLAECPVCNTNLADLGAPAKQEAHVKNCLEGGSGTTPQTAKYLVYKLPAESVLIGTECVICLEEFVQGSTVARLSCFCSFHNACLSSWLQRGRSCPVHAR